MVTGRFKSGSLARLFRRTPGGHRMRFRSRKPSKAHCARCKRSLQGVARGSAHQVRKLTRSRRRPERPFGGVLCTGCMRRHVIEQAR